MEDGSFIEVLRLSFGGGVVSIVLLLVGGALFTAAEVAFLAMGKGRARQLVEEGTRGGKLVVSLLEHPARLFATFLVAITFTQYSAEAVATYISREEITNVPLGEFIALPIVALIILVFCEVVPMVMTLRDPTRVALRVGKFIKFVTLLLLPVTFLMTNLANLLVRLVGVKLRPKPTVTEEDLKAMISVSEQQGFLQAQEGDLLESVFHFADREAHEIMVPRTEMVVAEASQPVEEVLNLMVENKFSRIPVYEGDVDHIKGIAHSKDLLVPLRQGRGKEQIGDFLRPAGFVYANQKVQDVVKELQRERRLMALVTDEFGGVEGLVTMEDGLEELVGEIFDEYDVIEEEIERAGKSIYVVDAGLEIHELNEKFSLRIPEEEGYSTVGGFLCSLAGRVPQSGEAFTYQGARFVVEKADERRVETVRLEILPPPSEES